jgi:hypothetical protein
VGAATRPFVPLSALAVLRTAFLFLNYNHKKACVYIQSNESREETHNLLAYLPTMARPYLRINIHRNGSDRAKTQVIAPLSANAYIIKMNTKGRTTTDYEKTSDRELCRLLEERLPDKKVPEVADYNRQTMIAFLKFFSEETR